MSEGSPATQPRESENESPSPPQGTETPLTAGEYKQTLQSCYLILHLSRHLRLDDALEWAGYADTMSSLFDPTLWMRNHGKLSEDIEVMRAVAQLQKLAQKAVPA
jgi:hypothetical protein